MSTFRVPVTEIRAIEPIPGADAIELAVVGDYRSVVRKGTFKAGRLAVYLPEASVLPDWMLKKLGLWDEEHGKGKLAGSNANRITALRLRGCLSQGILYPVAEEWDSPLSDELSGTPLCTIEVENVAKHDDGSFVFDEGFEFVPVAPDEDVAAVLGVTKYEPEIPECMLGEVFSLFGQVVNYDIENLKAFPEVLNEGEMVAYAEKVHGICTIIGAIPGLSHPEAFFKGDVYVTSKGLASQGFVFKDNEANADNLYVQTLLSLHQSIDRLLDTAHLYGKPIHLLGETFGQGVQDLNYGVKGTTFRGFEVYVGEAGQGSFMNVSEKQAFMKSIGIQPVDLLHVGPYSREKSAELRDGKTVTGNGSHIREGVVITPCEERQDMKLGRVILKDVSEAYLLRKGGTEFN